MRDAAPIISVNDGGGSGGGGNDDDAGYSVTG